MSTIRLLALTITLSLTATACYGAAEPGLRPAAVPALVDGAEVDIDVQRVRYWSDNEGRYVRGLRADSMTYNGEPLTYNQFRTLADPSWAGKLEEHARLVAACRRANIPLYIGLAGTIGGMFTGYFLSKKYPDDKALQYTAVGSLVGVGVASYAAGYLFFGGWKCTEAKRMADRLSFDDGGKAKLYDDALIREMANVAEEFNKRMRRGAQAKQPAEP